MKKFSLKMSLDSGMLKLAQDENKAIAVMEDDDPYEVYVIKFKDKERLETIYSIPLSSYNEAIWNEITEVSDNDILNRIYGKALLGDLLAYCEISSEELKACLIGQNEAMPDNDYLKNSLTN